MFTKRVLKAQSMRSHTGCICLKFLHCAFHIHDSIGGDLAGLGGVRDLRLPPAHHPQLLRQLLHLHVQGNFHYHTIPANDCF